MNPKCETSQREESFNIKLEDVEKLLSKNYKTPGSADKAIGRLKKILDEFSGK